MDRIENGMYRTNGSSTETHKKFPMHYDLWREKFESVYCTKYNTINISHLDVQKNVF